jgi:uncharacterized membrane protein
MHKPNETARVEAFSDGVFAIAITLLVLNLHVPRADEAPTGSALLTALLGQWPMYIAFLTSFLVILIMWVNHHNLFTRIRRVDQGFLFLNGLLLLGVTIVPFPTALLAEHIQAPGQNVAAMVYSGISIFIALAYNAVWRYAAHQHRLLDASTPAAAVRAINRQYAFGPLLYGAAFLMAFISAMGSVLILFGLAVFFAVTASTSRNEPG